MSETATTADKSTDKTDETKKKAEGVLYVGIDLGTSRTSVASSLLSTLTA